LVDLAEADRKRRPQNLTISRTNQWLQKLVEDKHVLYDTNVAERIRFSTKGPQCLLCRGTKMLCGKSICPVLVHFYSIVQAPSFALDLSVEGSCPPEIFVGRFGYPKVFVGPMIPPLTSDTSLLSTPELWFGKSIREVIDMRSQLVRGKHLVSIHAPAKGLDRISGMVQELGLASAPSDSEMILTKKPTGTLTLSDNFLPFGPSAPMKNLEISDYKVVKPIEKAFYDTDMKAEVGVLDAYMAGVRFSAIQRAFSVGVFGEARRRRFVPTRWSITAVDSIISNSLMRGVRRNALIGECQVYEADNLSNRYLVLLMPDTWRYEWIEAWYPKTAWNPGAETVIYGDHESYHGRTTYSDMGGCYYSVRLAAAEKLSQLRRQAAVVALREAYPGYILPVGVWHAREGVRAALRSTPRKFSSFKDTLDHISTRLKTPLDRWIEVSALLRQALYQTKLSSFVR